jgi:hypothetical protein
MDIALGFMSQATVRATRSYQQSIGQYEARISSGLQPSTPFLNLFNVHNQSVLLITSNMTYLAITLALFSMMRKKSQGYKLRWLLLAYDALNVCIAAYIAISTLKFKLDTGGGMLLCNPVSHEREALDIIPVFVLFYLQKFIEYFDTWFFILRKSSRQVTFLHLFHHVSITVVVGSILPFDYNGDMYLPIMLNSFNHMAVYLHYLLATLGIKSPWGSWITSMQLAQFVIIFAQSLIAFKIGPTCGSPDFAKLLMIAYMGSMVAVFARYWLQRYIFRRPNSSLDLCGVIKSPSLPESTLLSRTMQHCGTARLNDKGECNIALPEVFPDPSLQIHPLTSSRRFTFVYHLTPLNEAMPNLFVSAEVKRWRGPQAPVATKITLAETISTSKLSGTAVKVQSADNLLSKMNSRHGSDAKLSTGGAISKSRSYNSFAGFRHDDRIIDGPLPNIFESGRFKNTESSEYINPSLSRDVLDGVDPQKSPSGTHFNKLPLCFSISGGSPRGRVSWMVMTVPGDDDDDSRRLDDWRAIS